MLGTHNKQMLQYCMAYYVSESDNMQFPQFMDTLQQDKTWLTHYVERYVKLNYQADFHTDSKPD